MSALCSNSGADGCCLGDGLFSPADGFQRLGFQRRLRGVLFIFLFAFGLATAAKAAPPQITISPQPRTVVEGGNYTFAVSATGTVPLAYQWRKDAADLTAKTNDTLVLTAIQTADAGSYTVVITNLQGSVTSAPVRLIVRLAADPVYATPQGGWSYLFGGDTASGGLTTALDGTWDHSTDSWAGDGRGTDDPPVGGVGTTNGVLTLEDAVASGSGFNNRRIYLTHNLAQESGVTNASTLLNDGVTLTFRARLTPATDPLIELTNAPNGLVNNSDGKGMFGLRQAGSGGMIVGFSLHQAIEDLSTTANFNFAQAGLHLNNLNGDVRSANVDPGEGGTTNILALDPTAFHEFWITIQDNGPDPGTHRVSIYLDGSETPTVFNITAGVGSDGPATNYLALGLGSSAQRGAVDVDFFGYKAGVQLPSRFNEPVGILFQPTNVFTATGQVAAFSVGVTGTPPFGFQWYRNDAPIPDATNAIYLTPPVAAGDAGAQFRVVVTNDLASVTSSPPALLRLLGAPIIAAQPQSLTVTNGDPAAFSVSVDSGAAVSYQWRLAGNLLLNRTNATLAFAGAGPADAGSYDVVVSNTSGSITSAVAVLTVVLFDFGDAPDPGYPTLKASNGARHRIVPGIFLGTTVDGELDGLPDAAAAGDDSTGSADEDGVTFAGPLRVGRSATLAVVASTNGLLNAWVDFDRDSSWSGAGEQVFTNLALVAGTNTLSLAVPANASLGNSFARFRFSTVGGLSFTGAAPDGEVEDYAVTIQGVTDVGVSLSDAPDPVATTSNLTYTITVTNAGPSLASGVSLNDTLPAGVTFVFAQTSQGTCGANAGVVTCDLGPLNSGASATVLLRIKPNNSGALTNTVTVASLDFDPANANNTAVATTTTLDGPSIVVPPANLTVTNGGTATFNVTAAGTAPLRYQWLLGGNPLSGATNAALTIPNAQPANAGNYSVRVLNAVGSVESSIASLVVLIPPSITAQPQSRTNLAGSSATLSVVAAGSAPLFYQWRLNGASAVAGATNATLTFATVQSSNAGSYRVEVSNAAGSITSLVATLTVIEMDFGDAPAPYPTTLAADGARHRLVPGVRLGAAVDFEPNAVRDANATGDDLNGIDDEDGVLFNGPLRLGQTASISVIASTNGFLNAWIDFSRDGSWAEPGDQIATNRALVAGTNTFSILIPANGVAGLTYARFRFATASGLSFTGEAADGEVEDYALTLAATAELAVQRTSQIDPVAVGSNQVYGITITNAGVSAATGVSIADTLPPGVSFISATSTQGTCVPSGPGVVCFLGILNPGASASISLTCVPSVAGLLTNRATLTANEADLNPANNTAVMISTAMLPPQIVSSPQSQSVSNGGTATFSVTASGTSLRYQWRREGVNLAGATNSLLVLTNVQPASEGAYSVVVTNEVGSAVSAAANLSVLAPAAIVTQPQSRTIVAGAAVTFTVVAAGSAPLSYQWDYNGLPLAGQTGSILTLAGVSTNQAGPYRVRVSNSLGSVTSLTATLTVLVPPVITLQPESRTNLAGSIATFSGQADGALPLAYQWFFNQTNRLAGQTNTTLSLTNVVSAQAGGYSFVASNSGGQATSLVAILTVIELDFGDAPESLGYPTTLIFNGARHQIVPGVRMGNNVDFETNGQPNATATGDDLSGIDDEDGVIFSGPLGLGQTVLLPIIVSTNGFIDAWIDFNGNGTWADPEDQVLISAPVSQGTNLLPVSILRTAQLGTSFARFRFSTAGGLSYDGLAPDGEVEDYAVTIAPGVDLAATVTDSADPISLSSNVTLTVVVSNQGPSTATGVLLTNTLSPSMALISFSAGQGSCSNASGRVVCSLGTILNGRSATVTINARGISPGTLPTVAFVTANEAEVNPDDNTGVETTAVVAPPVGFANLSLINIADATATAAGLASPYPSTIVVSGLTGAVYKVTATLNNISHGFASDLDVLLVGPGGQNVMLMSDCGGNSVLAGVTLTLDDSAALSLPSGGAIASSTYRPTNYDPFSDTLPAPAPVAPFGTALSVFAGTNPNGVWSLFIMDDLAGDTGNIGGGWRLNITTADPIADLVLTVGGTSDSAPLNGNLVYAVAVTNLGPAAATGVSISNSLPAGVNFISATSTLGSCSLQAGQVVCSIGTLAPAAGAVATITVVPTVAGLLTNTFVASSRQVDFARANNTVVTTTTVRSAADLVLAQTAPASLLLGQQFTYVLNVTNFGPSLASNVRLIDALPAGAAFVSAVSSQGSCSLAAGTVTCNLGNLAVGARAQATIVANPSGVGNFTNTVSAAGDEFDPEAGNNGTSAVTAVSVLADLGVSITDAPDPVMLNGQVVYSITVTNLGPLNAAGVVLSNPLPASVNFISAVASQGSCALSAGTVTCSLGNLASAGRATVTLILNPTALGTLTNSVGVSTTSQDPVAANNTATTTTSVQSPPIIAAQPQNQAVTNGATAGFSVNATGTAPLAYQWQFNLGDIGGATNASLSLTNVTLAAGGPYRVRISNPVGAVTSTVATLTVLAPPVISHTPNQITDEDVPTTAIAFTVGDPDGPVGLLTVTALSSNPALLPTNNIVFGGSGSNLTIRLTPVRDQNGTATVSIIVRDRDNLAVSDTFDLVVRPINDPPTIADLLDQTILEDGLLVLPVFLGDVDNLPGDLQVTATSSLPALVATNGFVLTGTGTNRTLTLRPLTNAFGNATITVTVTDTNGASASATFQLTVIPVNDPPTLDPIANLTVDEDPGLQTVSLTGISGGATNEPPAASISATSSDQSIVPDPSVLYTPGQTNGTLTFTPVANANGAVTITVTVNDGGASNNLVTRTFTVTLNPVNDPPVISGLTNLTTAENVAVGPLPFSVSDVETAVTNLQVTVSSSNPGLVPLANIQLAGTGTNRTVTIQPAAHQNGSAAITLIVTDGSGGAGSNSFVLTVTAVNDPPTLGDVPDQITPEDTSLVVPISIADIETPADQLLLTVSSSNTNLVSDAGLAFNGTGGSRVLIVTPVADAFGTSTITLNLSDGTNVVNRTFILTVAPVNDPPTLAPLPDLTLAANAGVQTVVLSNITSGATNEAQSLIVTAVSSDPALIPAPTVSYSSPAPNGSLSFTPPAIPDTVVAITVTVNDGGATNNLFSRTFNVVVAGVNVPPTLAPIPDQLTLEDVALDVPISVNDSNTPLQNLRITVDSSNTNLVAAANIAIMGTGSARTLHILPATNQFGATTLMVTVADQAGGFAHASFLLTVQSVDDPPTLAPVADQVTREDTVLGPISLLIGSAEMPVSLLNLTATSLDTNLIPAAALALTGTGSNRSLTLTPASNQFGVASILLSVTDTNGLGADRVFTVAVSPVNDPPTLAPLSDLTINQNAGLRTVPLLGLGTGAANEIEVLTVTAVSSNPLLIPNPVVTYQNPQTTGTLSFASLPNANGSALITVTVDDGQPTNHSVSRGFTVTVNWVNDPPGLSPIANLSTPEDTPLIIPFSVSDDTTPASLLTNAVSSSDPNLFPAGSMVLNGTGLNRTLTVTPATNLAGVATLTLSVTDTNLATTTRTFVLTVLPVNDPPQIGDVPNQTMSEDGPPLVVPFTIGDVETPAGLLVVSAASSNPALLPLSALAFGGSGSNRTVTLTPLPDQNGVATVTLAVKDEGGRTASASFVVTVAAVNDAPVISAVPAQSIDEDTALTIAVGVGDVETAPGSLTLSATASDTNLIPAANFVFGGAGGSRLVTMVPATNRSGTATISLVVSDGSASATNAFLLTVVPVNDPPTLNPLNNLTLAEDAGLQTVNLSGIGSGAADEVQTLSVSAFSSNPGLIPAPAMVYASPNATGSMTFTPVPNASGVATITVTVDDGGASNNIITRSFTVTVNPVNDAPTLSNFTDQTINEDTPLTLSFTISDVETAPFLLTLSATSTNTTLLPTNNIVFNGDGTNRFVTLLPATNRFGTTFVTITVSDGAATASKSFLLTVNAVNDPPTLNPLTDVTYSGNPSSQTIQLSGIGPGGTNETEVLGVIANSSNTSLIPNPSVSYTSPNATGSISYNPANGGVGTAVVSVTVTGAGNTSITRTFTAYFRASGNTPPTITGPGNQTINEDAATGPLVFTVSDSGTPTNLLTVTASSSNTNLIPNANIVLAGNTGSRTVNLTPAPNQSGAAAITLSVTDTNFGFATNIFLVTVNPVNDLPQISAIPDQVINADTPSPLIPFVVTDVETPAAGLLLTAASTNASLIPVVNIAFGGSGTNRDLQITPVANQSGTSLITVTVNDGSGGITNRTFLVIVNPTNHPPTISFIANQNIDEDSATGPLAFTIGDVETAAGNLGINLASSNPALIPVANLALGGSGANRTITVTPLPDQNGIATITVKVTDGNGSTTNASFVVNVRPVNDPPTLDSLPNVTLNQGAAPQLVNLTGISSGAANEPQFLLVTAASSNPSLIPAPAVVYASPAPNGSLTLAPNPGVSGTATVTVTVNDGSLQNGTVSRTFTVTVNGAPSLSHIVDQIVDEDTATAALPFVIGDGETAPSALALAADSSDTNLVAVTNIVFAGSASNRTVTVRPATNQFGHATIRLTVTDADGLSSTDSFELVVNPVNDAPTLNALGNLVLNKDAGPQTVPLTGITTGASNEIQDLTVTAQSSNPGLIPAPAVSYSSPGTNGTLTFAPVPHASGVATLSVVVNDGQSVNGSVTQQFLVTINASNTPPLVAPIGDQATDEDVPLVIGVAVSDVETAAGALTVTAASSNQTLVPDGNILSLGSDGNRALRIMPARDQSGVATIKVTVTDGNGASNNTSFVLTVNPVNDPPVISPLNSLTIDQDTATAPLAFTVSDVDSAVDTLILSASSSNPALTPAGSIVFGGAGPNRNVTLTPASQQTGSALITVTVTDPGGASARSAFRLTVRKGGQPPSILTQPVSVTTTNGATVTFSVVAAGTGPLTYEWRRDGILLAGQTLPTLTLVNVQAADAGSYVMVVRNASGSAASQPAVLRLGFGPEIIGLARAGEVVTVSFETAAGGSYVIEYTDDLAGGAWTALPAVTGSGGTMTVNDPAATSRARFYRLRTN